MLYPAGIDGLHHVSRIHIHLGIRVTSHALGMDQLWGRNQTWLHVNHYFQSGKFEILRRSNRDLRHLMSIPVGQCGWAADFWWKECSCGEELMVLKGENSTEKAW